jgi:hypothetical protein
MKWSPSRLDDSARKDDGIVHKEAIQFTSLDQCIKIIHEAFS